MTIVKLANLKRRRTYQSVPMKNDFIVFDFEALGLKVHTDQPTQAGFVKLNDKFEVTDELNIEVRRNQYSIPGPKALEVTKISPHELDGDDRITEFEAAKSVSSILGGKRENGKRIFTGYNTLHYDEQLLRYFFFRNFQYPYVTSGDRSRKFDLFHAVRFLDFLRPGLIKPGHDENGENSWRLEKVIEANGIEMNKSHDALGDSIMTAELLKMFHRVAPDLMSTLVSMSSKNKILEHVASVKGKADYLYMYANYGSSEMKPLMPVADTDNGGVLCIDLSKDPDAWLSSSPEELLAAGGAFGKDVPFQILRPNACPYVFKSDAEEIVKRLEETGVDKEVYATRAAELSSEEITSKLKALAKLIDQDRAEKFSGDSVTEEETLYGGKFPDKFICRKFSEAKTWEERVEIVGEMSDYRLKAFGNRLIAMHAPIEVQTPESLNVLRKQIVLRLDGTEEVAGSVTTLSDARDQLDTVDDLGVREVCAQYLDSLEDNLRRKVAEIDERLGNNDVPSGAQLSLF